MAVVSTEAELAALYDSPGEGSLLKETDRVIAEYRELIAAAPFAVLATAGPEGLDCSPRGDRPGFVRVVDERTLQMPDRRGNNRLDSLRNVVRDPRVALLFLVPGLDTTLRVNGDGRLRTDPDLLAGFAVGGKAPRCVLEVAVRAVYFQCGRAVVRSRLWDPQSRVDPAGLPTQGRILAALSEGRLGGAGYDEAWPRRARDTLW